jgi:hypothetical protein
VGKGVLGGDASDRVSDAVARRWMAMNRIDTSWAQQISSINIGRRALMSIIKKVCGVEDELLVKTEGTRHPLGVTLSKEACAKILGRILDSADDDATREAIAHLTRRKKR